MRYKFIKPKFTKFQFLSFCLIVFFLNHCYFFFIDLFFSNWQKKTSINIIFYGGEVTNVK